jgi:anti-sigma-K factor RskA
MNDNPCERLDDFIIGELTDVELIEFNEHLSECDECLATIDRWNCDRARLKSAVELFETPNPHLLQRIEQKLLVTPLDKRATSERGRTLVALASAAFAIMILVFWIQTRTIENPRTELAASKTDPPIVSKRPELTFPDDVIALPVDIGDPNVVVVWLYPTAHSSNKSN